MDKHSLERILNMDYIGKWFVEDTDVDLLEIARTIKLVRDDPDEYDFTVDDIWSKANERGFDDSDINVALMNVMINEFAIMDGNEIVGFK